MRTQSNEYRVWPDGTLQDVSEGPAYSWMSDDYVIIEADDETAAYEAAYLQGYL